MLRQGVEQGRETFANTLKYIAITTSANFGNMISMAAASLLLPFLPLLAKQILLNNFLSDIPAMAIASDNVDSRIDSNVRADGISASLRRFMVIFGVDQLAVRLRDLRRPAVRVQCRRPELFRTGWFVESLMTELVIILVIRTYRPFYRSRPGRLLWMSTAAMMASTVALPVYARPRAFRFCRLAAAAAGRAVAELRCSMWAPSELGKRLIYPTAHIQSGSPSSPL